MQKVLFEDLGKMNYADAWDYQELLLKRNVDIKTRQRLNEGETPGTNPVTEASAASPAEGQPAVSAFVNPSITINGHSLTRPSAISTEHYLLFVEHPPVYTLGKSGHMENILINEEEMKRRGIAFYKTNRGGDITFHGPGQVVGYPILDLEKFYTDIGKYLRNLEEVVILTMAGYGLKGERSAGETGVWLDPGIKGRERKICAMGVRCSRWITMHGFAFNVNTDLDYFSHIIPCGIQDKAVTSLQKELGRQIEMEELKEALRYNFEMVFDVELSPVD